MRHYSIAVQLVILGLVSSVSSGVLANIPPDSAAQATDDFVHRRDAMVKRLIAQLVDEDDWDSSFKPTMWGREGDDSKTQASTRVAMASAVLWVLSHPSDFDNGVDGAYNLLQGKATGHKVWSKDRYMLTWGYWVGNPADPTAPAKISRLFKLIYYFKNDHCYADVHVGTKCDYDFVLVDLAHLLYTFRDGDTPLDDPRLTGPGAPPSPHSNGWTFADFLSNEMIFNIICQYDKRGGTRDCQLPDYKVRYAFMDLSDELTYRRHVDLNDNGSGTGIIQAETENHVLNIVTWDYLISNWVMWQGSLGNSSRRNYADMNDLAWANGGRYQLHGKTICERVLEVTGRVMHSGMYETNSRPYGRVALSALLALANFGSPFDADIPFTLPCTMDDVKRGARNAVDYLAAKFAFQSLRGKRQGPMRRVKGMKKQIDFYSNNSFVTMMSLLSGVYEWNDCVHNEPDILDGGRWKCPILRSGTGAGSKMSSYAAIASSWVGGYRIPKIIQEQMFERGPFYARMKTRYTKDHYKSLTGWPKYFDGSDTQAFHSDDNRSSVELYFGDDNILLAAGGSNIDYYVWTDANTVWAKPTMLIPRGDFGHHGEAKGEDPPWEWEECSYRGAGTGDAHHDVMLSPGKTWHWWASECNVWLYRNFVYGYLFHDRHGGRGGDWNIAPRDFSKTHPFYAPEFWGSKDRQGAADKVVTFSIGVAEFEIFEFSSSDSLRPPSAAAHGPYGSGDGYFIVRARFRKDFAGKKVIYRKHREFSRGFLEIIPRSVFPDAEQLQNEIQFWNKDSYFSGGDRFESWKYVLTLSKEKVHMGTHMGANSVGGEGCDDGILSIYEYDWPSADWGPGVDMEERFIPPDISVSDDMKKIPLITVWQLDDRYEPTDCKLVETTHEGVVVIRQPTEICDPDIVITCVKIPGWRCLKLDSYRWKDPKREVEEASLDCHCFE